MSPWLAPGRWVGKPGRQVDVSLSTTLTESPPRLSGQQGSSFRTSQAFGHAVLARRGFVAKRAAMSGKTRNSPAFVAQARGRHLRQRPAERANEPLQRPANAGNARQRAQDCEA